MFYFEIDIDAPSDDRRLSISTVNRQMYNDNRQICAVNFRRKRGGTVLKEWLIVQLPMIFSFLLVLFSCSFVDIGNSIYL